MVFCLYGIFKSNLCLPRCFFRCVHLFWLLSAASTSSVNKPFLCPLLTNPPPSEVPRLNLRCVHLLWLPTTAAKTLRYSHATVRSRINTTRPLLSLNYRNRAKLHSRDLLNLIKSQDFIKLPS